MASQGTRIITDKLIGEAAESSYDIIVLPGGPTGSERLQKSKILKKLLKEQHESGQIYGATNSSSTVLYKHGLLKEKRTTVYPSDTDGPTDQQMIEGAEVVIDGNVITSLGPQLLPNFPWLLLANCLDMVEQGAFQKGLCMSIQGIKRCFEKASWSRNTVRRCPITDLKL